MPNPADAKVGKPDISEGTLDTSVPEPTVSAGPVLESESGVDLAKLVQNLHRTWLHGLGSLLA